MARLYRISARLSIVVGVLSIIAALALGIFAGIQTPPGDPYSVAVLGGSLIIIGTFACYLGIAPALIAWIDPATRPLSRIGLSLCLIPFLIAPLLWLLTAGIARLTGHA